MKTYFGLPGPDYRQYNHRHNGLLGTACRSRRDFTVIASAPSASQEAKATAQEILRLQSILYEQLRAVRVEPDGTITMKGTIQ